MNEYEISSRAGRKKGGKKDITGSNASYYLLPKCLNIDTAQCGKCKPLNCGLWDGKWERFSVLMIYDDYFFETWFGNWDYKLISGCYIEFDLSHVTCKKFQLEETWLPRGRSKVVLQWRYSICGRVCVLLFCRSNVTSYSGILTESVYKNAECV